MVVTAKVPTPIPEASESVSVRRDFSRTTARRLMLAVTAVGAVIRLVNLDALGFNSDEAVYAGQAASLAGNPAYTDMFPVFRAHPMLVQSILSIVYRDGEHDTAGRAVVAVFGVLTLVVVYLLGCELYDRRTGVLAATLLAVMPYHVIVSRQVLLDVPMVLFTTLSLLCLAKFARTQRLSWMIAAGGAMGLAMLAKESSIVLLVGVYMFLALSPTVRRPVFGALIALIPLAAVFLVHPVTQALAGHSNTGKSYLIWQLLRRPNHSWEFYPATVPWALGPLVLAAMLAGLWLARRRRSWREVLLGAWILAPVVFFELWPVKGFQYLLPIAPAVAIVAARGVLSLPMVKRRSVHGLAAGLLTLSLLAASVPVVLASGRSEFLAGSGGVAGGRETGKWIGAGTPAGATVLTLGPSMANIVQYYGHRRAYGLSVSPNPLHRNPSYTPIVNADRQMRQGDLQYVVWDAYSSARSPHFSDRLLELARRYHGRVVHTELVGGKPAIVVYEVRS